MTTQKEIDTVIGESQIKDPEKWNDMKPQFTEENAIGFLQDIFETADDDFPHAIKTMKRLGYIRKSDLEILIEECEILDKYISDRRFEPNDLIHHLKDLRCKQRDCIQAMKAELNKRGSE